MQKSLETAETGRYSRRRGAIVSCAVRIPLRGIPPTRAAQSSGKVAPTTFGSAVLGIQELIRLLERAVEHHNTPARRIRAFANTVRLDQSPTTQWWSSLSAKRRPAP